MGVQHRLEHLPRNMPKHQLFGRPHSRPRWLPGWRDAWSIGALRKAGSTLRLKRADRLCSHTQAPARPSDLLNAIPRVLFHETRNIPGRRRGEKQENTPGIHVRDGNSGNRGLRNGSTARFEVRELDLRTDPPLSLFSYTSMMTPRAIEQTPPTCRVFHREQKSHFWRKSLVAVVRSVISYHFPAGRIASPKRPRAYRRRGSRSRKLLFCQTGPST